MHKLLLQREVKRKDYIIRFCKYHFHQQQQLAYRTIEEIRMSKVGGANNFLAGSMRYINLHFCTCKLHIFRPNNFISKYQSVDWLTVETRNVFHDKLGLR